MKPKVTIGVCVRNCSATIHQTIESIISQDYPHELMEVIFVDDGSEDETLSIIKRYAKTIDMKVKIFHHEWKGLGVSRNVVVDNAEGKYIIWVDGDMILPPDHVRKQIEFMENNPKVGIAKARRGMLPGANIIEVLENTPFMILDLKNEPLESKLPGTGGSIYRVDAIRQVGGFDEKLRGTGEDQDLAYRIKTSGWNIKRSPTIFYERRNNTWSTVWKKWIWYGFGDYDLYRKNRDILSLFKMNPLAGFMYGLLQLPYAYKLIPCKFVFILPFYVALKMIAWCLGFLRKQKISH